MDRLKAEWYNKFSGSSCMPFYVNSTSQRQVNMMYLETGHLSRGCKYAEDDLFRMIQLPYADKSTDELPGVYFNVIMPRERFGLDSALKDLSAKTRSGLFEKLEGRNLIVRILIGFCTQASLLGSFTKFQSWLPGGSPADSSITWIRRWVWSLKSKFFRNRQAWALRYWNVIHRATIEVNSHWIDI